MKKFEPTLPAVQETIRVAAQVPFLDAEYEPQPAHVPLAHYLWILRRHGWRIAGFVAGAVLATLVVSLRLTPVYESTVTVDVDRQMPTGVLGQEALQNVTNDADQFLATQVKLIQSDSVLRPVVDKYRLREVEKDALEEAVDKSATSLQAPVILKNLKVTRPPNTYLLLISYRSQNRQLAADVANEIAQQYLLHTYRIRYKATASLSDFMERQLEELKAQMEKSSEALNRFERDLNVINPEEKTNIISARLLQLNEEYTKAQADRVKKEAAYNSVKDGTLAAAQVSTQGEALKKLTENLNDAQEKFAEVKDHYGVNHPEYKKAQTRVQQFEAEIEATRRSIGQRIEVEYHESVNREAMLEAAVKDTKAEFDRLNARSFEYQTLKREAEGDKKLYEELVRKIKEAGINASFQNSSIRVADTARPGLKPVFPKTWLNALLAFLFAAFLGVGAAVLSDVLDNTIRDPDQVARLLNTDVIGSLPAVKDWRRRLSPIQSMAAANGHVNGNGQAAATALARAAEHEQVLSNLRRGHPHAAQLDSAHRFRPPPEKCSVDQRLTVRRQVHRGRASGRDARKPAQANAADRRRPAPPQCPSPVPGSQQRGVVERAAGADFLARRGDSHGRSQGSGRSPRRTLHAPRVGSDGHGPGRTDRGSHARVRPGGPRRPAASGFRRAFANGNRGRRSDRRSASRRHQQKGSKLGNHHPGKIAREFSGCGVE